MSDHRSQGGNGFHRKVVSFCDTVLLVCMWWGGGSGPSWNILWVENQYSHLLPSNTSGSTPKSQAPFLPLLCSWGMRTWKVLFHFWTARSWWNNLKITLIQYLPGWSFILFHVSVYIQWNQSLVTIYSSLMLWKMFPPKNSKGIHWFLKSHFTLPSPDHPPPLWTGLSQSLELLCCVNNEAEGRGLEKEYQHRRTLPFRRLGSWHLTSQLKESKSLKVHREDSAACFCVWEQGRLGCSSLVCDP